MAKRKEGDPSPDGISCPEKGARQADQASCDINTIVKMYERSGVVPVAGLVGTFEDVSQIGDFRSALEKIQAAEEKFMELPPEVRFRFGNDPLSFVDFAVEPANLPELRKLGLVAPVEAPVAPVAPVAVVPPVVPA